MADRDFRFPISDFRFLISNLRFQISNPKLLVVWLVVCLRLSMSTARAADEITIEPAERWSSVFAGAETTWTYHIRSKQPIRERVAWRLTANQRTLASGEAEARGDADKPAEVSIPLRWPNVKDGVVLGVQLSVSVGETTHVKPVWVFPNDPFSDRQEWLKQLNLMVFDPEGDTVKQFEASDIPHSRIRQRDALDDVTEGIIVIGERTSLAKHDGLLDDLQATAARGIPVLCLASEEGHFPWPGKADRIGSVTLRRTDVIRELDKRLDAAIWPSGKSPVSRGLIVTTRQDDVIAEVSEKPTAWPWCEWLFASHCHDNESSKETTRLIWCGFRVIEAWDDGPTPRYLLARMFERLEKRRKDKEDGEH